MGVSTSPGQIAVQRTPSLASSAPVASVSPITAAFVAE
jgi:hypothetical protein